MNAIIKKQNGVVFTPEMETIKISKKDFKEMSNLYYWFYKIYGNRNTVWSLGDLDELRKIGQEFMDIFVINLKKQRYAKTFFNYRKKIFK